MLLNRTCMLKVEHKGLIYKQKVKYQLRNTKFLFFLKPFFSLPQIPLMHYKSFNGCKWV